MNTMPASASRRHRSSAGDTSNMRSKRRLAKEEVVGKVELETKGRRKVLMRGRDVHIQKLDGEQTESLDYNADMVEFVSNTSSNAVDVGLFVEMSKLLSTAYDASRAGHEHGATPDPATLASFDGCMRKYFFFVSCMRKCKGADTLRLCYLLGVQFQRCAHVGSDRTTHRRNDRLLASLILERSKEEHEIRQARYDVWNAMGKAIADADEELRNSVMGESALLQRELNHVGYARVELEKRAEMMKSQGVDKWYPRSHAAFMKALRLKLGQNYLQQRLTWRCCGVALDAELDLEEGIQ